MEQQLLIYTNGSLSNFINFYGFLPSSKLKRKLFIIQLFQIIKKNHVKNFFDRKGKLKSSLKIMQEQNIKKNFYFKWCQLIYQSLNRGRNKWKEKLSKPYLNHHLLKNNQIDSADKLDANELSFFSISVKKILWLSCKKNFRFSF